MIPSQFQAMQEPPSFSLRAPYREWNLWGDGGILDFFQNVWVDFDYILGLQAILMVVAVLAGFFKLE